MIEALIVAVLVVAMFQESEHFRFPGLVLGAMALTNYAIVDSFALEGFYYCFAAASCDALVIFLIASFAKVTRVSDAIIAISCVSIILNLNGWLLYHYELPLEPYNYSQAALYLIAILSLLWKDLAHDYYPTSKRNRGLRLLTDSCGVLRLALFKKART